MAVVGVVQMAVDQVADVVAVGHRLVTASRAMGMRRIVTITAVVRCARRRIGAAYFQTVFVDVVTVRVVQVTVVQVIDVIVVFDCDMPALGAVNVGMIGVWVARHPQVLLWGFKSRFCRHQLGGMLQNIVQKLGHMVVGQGIVHVASFAPAVNQTQVAEQPQPLRHR